MKVYCLRTQQSKPIKSKLTGDVYTYAHLISNALGAEQLRVTQEIVPAGHAMSKEHLHTHNEEIIIVLRGSVQAKLSAEYIALDAGHSMRFAPGCPHVVINTGLEEAEVIVISSQHKQDEIHYVT